MVQDSTNSYVNNREQMLLEVFESAGIAASEKVRRLIRDFSTSAYQDGYLDGLAYCSDAIATLRRTQINPKG